LLQNGLLLFSRTSHKNQCIAGGACAEFSPVNLFFGQVIEKNKPCFGTSYFGSLIPSTRYIFYPKGLAPLSERIENNGASPFGFKKKQTILYRILGIKATFLTLEVLETLNLLKSFKIKKICGN
jgi:hypothetical protein